MIGLVKGTVVGVICAAGVAGGQLIEEQHISIATLVAVCSVVMPATWWLSRKFTKIDDRFQDGSEKFQELSEALKKIECKLEAIPCKDPEMRPEHCPYEPPGRRGKKDLSRSTDPD